MRASVVAASASTVTVSLTDVRPDTSDLDVIVAAASTARAYGIDENGHRISRRTPTTDNPVAAVVTLDRAPCSRRRVGSIIAPAGADTSDHCVAVHNQ